jgi:hypothetical protein
MENISNLLDISTLSIDKSLLGRKRIPDKYISNYTDVITNYASLKYEKKDQYFIYAIIVRNINKPDEEIRPYIIKQLTKCKTFQVEMRNYFKDLIISGQSMYACPLNQITDMKIEVMVLENSKVVLINELSKDDKEEYKDFIYEINFKHRLAIKDINDEYNATDLNILKSFYNIQMCRSLNQMGYMRADMKDKSIYFKRDHERDDQHLIFVRPNLFFAKGIKLSSDVFDQNKIFVKAIQKFRLLYTSSYMDLFYEYREDFDRFRRTCRGRRGKKTYDGEEVKITDIIFENPANVTFKHPKFGEVSITQFMQLRWNKDIEDKKQPIFVRHIKATKTKEESTSYYLPQYVKILGKLPEDEKENFAKYLSMTPQNKFYHTVTVLKELFAHHADKKEIVNPVKLTKVPILVKPVLEFNDCKKNVTDEGKIGVRSI